MRPVAGSRPTWPASTSQSPARTAGEYGPATGGAFGVGTGVTGIDDLLDDLLLAQRAARARLARGERFGTNAVGARGRVPRGRCDGGEDRVGSTRARRTVVVDDLDVDRRHRARP